MSKQKTTPHAALKYLVFMLTIGQPKAALAHASEQGFVLLLPTDVYILAGTTSVALTIFLVAVLPASSVTRAFRAYKLIRWPTRPLARQITSCLSALFLLALIWAGLTGLGDPLANPLPLFVWTVWWVGFVSFQGVGIDLWRWVNPWTGPVSVTRRLLRVRPFLRLPPKLGHFPALGLFVAFTAFLLADPAPSDPNRLAWIVSGYWAFSFGAALSFGPGWMYRGEALSVLMRSYAQMNLFGRNSRHLSIGLPGWRALRRRAPSLGMAIFFLVMLGSGSFDGLNETFWWLDVLGINPLEFPGRSAVIVPTLVGLVVANLALIALFAVSVHLGLKLAQVKMPLIQAICVFAPSILPIALGYHIAHYLPGFLVNIQYVALAVNDPLGHGNDLFGLGQFYVTTGFFNSQASVRLIWLTQAGAVVAGHMVAVLLAHGFAIVQFGPGRKSVLVGTPLAIFMILYTLFGLWLLASPRGA